MVRLPPVDLTVIYGGSGLDGATVYLTPTSPDCGTAPINMGLTGVDPRDATKHGKLTFPGVPWGDYDICAEYQVPAGVAGIPAGWYSARKLNQQVRTINGLVGGAAPTIDMATATGPGTRCP
jgi:hypothetical protein